MSQPPKQEKFKKQPAWSAKQDSLQLKGTVTKIVIALLAAQATAVFQDHVFCSYIFPAVAAQEMVRYEHDSIKVENWDKIKASPSSFRQTFPTSLYGSHLIKDLAVMLC